MATKLTPVVPVVAGIVCTLAAAAATATKNSFTNTGKEIILVRNDSADPITVRIESPTAPNGQAVGLLTSASIAAGEEFAFGPYPPNFTNPTDNLLTFSVSLETDVFVRVLQFAPSF